MHEIWGELKSLFRDLKDVGRESGIFAFLLCSCALLFLGVLFIITLPFKAFIDWSKTWFGGDHHEN